MAIGKKVDAIQNQGSNLFYFCECDAEGTTTGAFSLFAIMAKTSITDETSVDNVNSEDGAAYPVDSTREAMITVTPMQRDLDTLDFANNTARGKYYHTLYRVTKSAINGSHIWHTFGITKVDPKMAIEFPGTETTEVVFRAISNTSALTIDASSVDAGLSSIAIAADAFYSFDEVAT